MKMNIKKHVKACMAAFLTLAIVLQLFAGIGVGSKVEAANTDYKEMQFTDWSVSVGAGIYSLPDSSVINNTLDGVAISGKVNLNNKTWTDGLISVGGTSGSPNGGFWFCNGGGLVTGMAYIPGNDLWRSVSQTGFQASGVMKWRMTFDETLTNTWLVRLYIEGNLVSEETYVNAIPGTYIGYPSGVTISENKDYKEMKFTDWGISEGDCYGYDVYKLSNSGTIDSLNDVAISGKVNFNGDATAIIRVGGWQTDSKDSRHAGFALTTKSEDGSLVLWPQEIGGISEQQVVLDGATWATLMNQTIDLRMEFSKNDANVWKVKVYINGDEKGSFGCGAATPGLYLAKKGATIEGFYDYLYLNLASYPDGYMVDKLDGIIDDVAVHHGNYYKEIGEHTLEFTDNGSEVAQKLILFVPGDTTLDSHVNLVDLVRAKHYIKGTASTAMNMANKAATNLWAEDEVLTDEDAAALRELLLTYEAPQASDDGIHYGLGEPITNLGKGEVDYASTKFITSMVGAYGVDTFRVWLPSIGTAKPNGNGTYSVTLDKGLLAELKELVARLQLNGVEQIVALPEPIIPHDYPKYVGKDGNSYSQQDMEDKKITNDDLVRMEYYAWPDPTGYPDMYKTFMDVQKDYFKLLTQEVPEITHYEGINEPENKNNYAVHKFGYLDGKEMTLLDNATNYDQNAYIYDMDMIAKITMDFNRMITAGITEAGTDAKVLFPGLTMDYYSDPNRSYNYVKAAYSYIENGGWYDTTNPDQYFTIFNWHPYVFDYAHNLSTDSWFSAWVNYQNGMYDIVKARHGREIPVWITELGASDYGKAGGETTEDCAFVLENTIRLAKEQLPYVDTIIGFRLFDKLNSEQTEDRIDAGQDNYGMIEDFNNAAGAAALKTYGKKFFDIVKPQVKGDYSALAVILDKYYGIYKNTYALDQNEDFESAIVRNNTLVTNHSDMTVAYSCAAEYMMIPRLSLIEKDDGQVLAFDYEETTGVQAAPVSHISFNMGRLEAGTYKLTFDIDGESLDSVGYWGTTFLGVTTNTVPFDWTNGAIATDKDNQGTGIVNYRWATTNQPAVGNTITFTLTKAQENIAVVFQIQGNVQGLTSKGAFRVYFNDIALTKVN